VKFYADENIPKPFVVGLRALGHDVTYAVEATRSLRDLTILRETFKEDTLIITQDKDYWRYVLVEKRPTLGVVWVRLSGLRGLAQKTERVIQVIQERGDLLAHHFMIIYPDRLEIHPL
jgi:predicted nuclease of predicted toxin-antitoxin system